MIVTEQKPFEEIKEALSSASNIVVIGCGLCATLCNTGGQKEVDAMSSKLISAGKNVVGTLVIEGVCNKKQSNVDLRKIRDAVDKADTILCMSCGNGYSVLAELLEQPVHPALNTLFLGIADRGNVFEERCILCGECVAGRTAGICPITRCSKGLLNGPCGGTSGGKCEADPDRDCGWYLIYEKLKGLGKLDLLKEYTPPKDSRMNKKPQKIGGKQQ